MLTRYQARLQRQSGESSSPGAQPSTQRTNITTPILTAPPVIASPITAPIVHSPFPEDTLSFGLELEFVVLGTSDRDHASTQRVLAETNLPWKTDNADLPRPQDYLNSINAHCWQVKDDCSIRPDFGPARLHPNQYPWEGVEITSPVMFGDTADATHRDQIERVCRDLRSKLKLQLPQSAGTHVHVGLGRSPPAGGFSMPLLRRLFTIMYMVEGGFIDTVVAPWRKEKGRNPFYFPLRQLADGWLDDLEEAQQLDSNLCNSHSGAPTGDVSFDRFMGDKVLGLLSQLDKQRLRTIWGLDEDDLMSCMAQHNWDNGRPLLCLNEELKTVEFRYLHACLDPAALVAYTDLCVTLVKRCQEACSPDANQRRKARSLLRQLLFEVYAASDLKGNDHFAGRLLVHGLGLHKDQKVWDQMMSEAYQEMDHRRNFYAEILQPLGVITP